ncbi:uncharacterized protein [Aristolochia californica]|uniref:uncharacterized protein n=1 Tax=Aristolochia californica TaxID=171875 RepID=UPI0035E25821
MAPKRRTTESPKPAASFSPRRTRSSTAGTAVASKPVELPPTKKRKLSKSHAPEPEVIPEPRKGNRAKRNLQEVENPARSETVVVEQKSSKENATKADVTPVHSDGKTRAKKRLPVEEPPAGSRTIIIEHCKQCSTFRRRSEEVRKGLEDGLPDIVVQINPEKPRRGCFEIREESGETFVSLLDMPRPFKKLTELDMDEVIAGIIEKIK